MHPRTKVLLGVLEVVLKGSEAEGVEGVEELRRLARGMLTTTSTTTTTTATTTHHRLTDAIGTMTGADEEGGVGRCDDAHGGGARQQRLDLGSVASQEHESWGHR